MIPPALSMFLTRRLDRSPHPKAPHLRIALTFSFPAILEDHVAVSLVLTDIKLPGSMDGIKLAAAIRDRWPPIKIVATLGRDKLGRKQYSEGGVFCRSPTGPPKS
jgi:DNA-binding LytR/AlgR family response regulator